MTIIGLSLLVVTFTFFLYKIPSSWSLPWALPWLRPAIGKPHSRDNGLGSDLDESRRDLDQRGDGEAGKDVVINPGSDLMETKASSDVISPGSDLMETKASSDRKAMPPPMMVQKRDTPDRQISPASERIQTRSAATIIQPSAPEFEISEPQAPSFPALNSAQRASGGRGPPRLNPIPVSQPPLRSISSMSPPLRSPAPNRGGNSSLAPPPTHTSIPAKPRQKIELTPGHSPLDWAMLSGAPNANLTGLPAATPYLKVSPSELRRHTGRKGKDAWTVLGGKVYNITPYLPYHPGGEAELMKCAGRDGTKLFAEVHPWVNWEGMLRACLVGIAVSETEISRSSMLEDMD